MPKDQDQNQNHDKAQAASVVIPITGKSRHRTGTNKYGVTDKQEAFALAVFEGNNFSDAYRLAYDTQNMNTASIHREAHALTLNPINFNGYHTRIACLVKNSRRDIAF